MPNLVALLSVALDLTASLGAEDRYRRLLEAVRRVMPCDAACLLRYQDGVLVPLAALGLTPEALGRTYRPREHPRLDLLCHAEAPVRFPPDTDLPDPFDGLLASDATALAHVHACLGFPLRVEGTLIGVLTADALDARAFDGVDARALSWVGALAGAAMRTSQLIDALEQSAERLGLVADDLRRAAERERGDTLIGTSPAMQKLRDEIALVGPSDLTVLVTGETGSGKELVARAVHAASRRRGEPLLRVNCAALPEAMAESELFGHVRGAFTGAERHRPGKLEVADKGTLFLDEIGELPPSIQPKLLRALQEGEVQRVGADRALRVDVRVVAATNRDIEKEVAAGRFRADLFHRLNVYRLSVPPLRERRSDIPLLAGHFCDEARARLGVGPVRLTPAAREILMSSPWPGNVRELENTLFRMVLQASRGVPRGEPVVLTPAHLGADLALGAGLAPAAPAQRDEAPAPLATGAPLHEQVDAFQRDLIRKAVAQADGNWAAAARSLGMHRSNLHHLARRLGLR
ncbi:transcriptional regulator [Sorangium cellulosum]|uniref:Transcriptional regulator n=1 Tax=Sorangium cellulosum TaxID=56 RepID=A0A4P2Q0V2_SORCE|nr:nitric oxide reductase transcriptional regulator NorR [Sorangium cellulosum]AUX22548.1 transcriptional regulator [Sorangium cellulosum]